MNVEGLHGEAGQQEPQPGEEMRKGDSHANPRTVEEKGEMKEQFEAQVKAARARLSLNQFVWAPMGGYGWSEAYIIALTPTRVHLVIRSKRSDKIECRYGVKTRKGVRHVCEVLPRVAAPYRTHLESRVTPWGFIPGSKPDKPCEFRLLSGAQKSVNHEAGIVQVTLATVVMKCPKCKRVYRKSDAGLNCGYCLLDHAEIIALVPATGDEK